MSLQTISSINALYPSLVMRKVNMEDKKPSGIDKVITGFLAKLVPIKPRELSPAQLAEKKALRIAAEKAKQKRYKRMEKLKGSKILAGVAASPGMVVGMVRNVHERDSLLMAQIKTGEVLVAETLMAYDLPYMEKASAFVLDSSGTVGSVAIVAKGMGKPAVTGTLEATSVLKDGQKVVVDGSEGAVYECRESSG